MKLTKLFGIGAIAVLLGATSCNSEPQTPAENGDGVLRITLQGTNLTRATGTPADDSAIKNFTVYVFNAENNTLEESQTFTNATTGTISGLSTGFPKDIVVLANVPSTYPVFNKGDHYDQFVQAQAAINLSTQNPANVATDGLLMIGVTDSPVTIQLTGVTQVPVSMERLVARVRLGTITVISAEDTEIDLFEITGVGIQRALATTDVFGNPINPTSMFCGIPNGSWNSTVVPYLYDAIAYEQFEEGVAHTYDNYFYVLPNQMIDSCTLLTVVSKYNGDEQFFPIAINKYAGQGSTDGTLLLSNHSYVINIVVNNLNEGTTDPDVEPQDGSIEVILTVEPWETEIVQNVIW